MTNSPRLFVRRPISDAEAAVVERALTVAATDAVATELLDQVRDLQIVDGCNCGCASVEFGLPPPGAVPGIVADALAHTPGGEQVGVIVRALDGVLTGLEIYSFGDDPAPLPVVASIVSFDEAGRARDGRDGALAVPPIEHKDCP